MTRKRWSKVDQYFRSIQNDTTTQGNLIVLIFVRFGVFGSLLGLTCWPNRTCVRIRSEIFQPKIWLFIQIRRAIIFVFRIFKVYMLIISFSWKMSHPSPYEKKKINSQKYKKINKRKIQYFKACFKCQFRFEDHTIHNSYFWLYKVWIIEFAKRPFILMCCRVYSSCVMSELYSQTDLIHLYL